MKIAASKLVLTHVGEFCNAVYGRARFPTVSIVDEFKFFLKRLEATTLLGEGCVHLVVFFLEMDPRLRCVHRRRVDGDRTTCGDATAPRKT